MRDDEDLPLSILLSAHPLVQDVQEADLDMLHIYMYLLRGNQIRYIVHSRYSQWLDNYT